uniref:Uncharacterized protein n=1 Tax=Moniliophthora roreri TaxID=221103 RepID=A0A0W0F2Y6_MONRR
MSATRSRQTDPAESSYGRPSTSDPRQSSTARFPDVQGSHIHPAGDTTSSNVSKKKSTRIPLFGRPRKKSAHSDVVRPDTRRRHDSESQKTSGFASEPDHSVPARASLSQPSLPSPSQHPETPGPVQLTLGSRIAAHFSLTPRKSPRKPKAGPSIGSDLTASPANSKSHRDSAATSRHSGDRRTSTSTRQPTTEATHLVQPTITISRPPQDLYDLGEYDDLFTKPRGRPKPNPIEIHPPQAEPQINTPVSSSPKTDFISSDGGNHSSAPSTPTLLTPTISSSSHLPSIDDKSTTSGPQATGPEISPSMTRDTSRDKRSHSLHQKTWRGVPRRNAGTDTEIYSAGEESDAMSVMSMPLSGTLSNMKRRNITSVLQDRYGSTPRGMRSKEKSRISSLAPTKPPSIPLPATPNTGKSGSVRQRAQTLSPSTRVFSPNGTQTLSMKRPNPTSTRPSTTPPPPPPPKDSTDTFPDVSKDNRLSDTSTSSSSSSTPTLTKEHFPNYESLDIDIDGASEQELRAGLRKQTSQLTDLASYFLKLTDMHAQEKSLLEKKIASLESDIMRRDKEIKGLTWLLSNTPPPEGSHGPRTERSAETPDLDKERSDDSSARSTRLSTPSPSTRLPMYRTTGEDSGTESYATSGAESLFESGASGTELWHVSSRPRRLQSMKRLMLVENFNRSRTQSLAVKQAEGRAMEAVYDLSPSRLSKRSAQSSTYSISSSGSSPLSSPTTVMSITASGLSSIPETTQNHLSKDQRLKERNEQGSQPSNRHPKHQPSKTSPQPTSPTRLTPSEAYARNLMKGPPSSIGQVLDSSNNTPVSPIMQESFGGRSRALLGIASLKTKSGASNTPNLSSSPWCVQPWPFKSRFN